MSRLTRQVAIARARTAHAGYVNAQADLVKATNRRKGSMLSCVEAGLTITETAAIFDVTRSAVSNVLRELADK